jgi:glycosyltransferase involved in cell wall biosynthesis
MSRKILFIHPNFPGQFLHLARRLVASGNEVVGLGEAGNLKRQARMVPGVKLVGYSLKERTSKTHHYARLFEDSTVRAQATLQLCLNLKKEGFRPDVIAGHTGWGDLLFLREVFPEARICGYFEYYYRPEGADIGFDPEFPHSLDNRLEVRMKNATALLTWPECDAHWTPTCWQASLFPAELQKNLHIQHEGIDTQKLRPDPEAKVRLADGAKFHGGEEILTFVNRGMEPYRGLHIFLRALPEILARRPQARVLLIGRAGETPYGNQPRSGGSWQDSLLHEAGDRIDRSRVHFLGRVPHEAFVKILQLSRAHVYLTYPYFLSWSMLEAMSAGCLVIGSRTPPVTEFLEDGKNGLLVDFFDVKGLADGACEALAEPEKFAPLRAAARRRIVEELDMKTRCVPAMERFLTGE